MARYETSISIRAQPERAWLVLSDVAAWPEWLHTVTSVRPLDGTSLAVGSRYTVRQPGLQPVTWRVTELEPARRFSWEARSPGLRMFAEHIVDPESSRASNVILRFSFSGALGGLIGALYRSVTQRYIASEAASLKQKVETALGPNAPA